MIFICIYIYIMSSDDDSSDDERNSQGDEIYPDNNNLLLEGQEFDLNDYTEDYNANYYDNPREINLDLLELFVEHFDNHEDFINTAQNRTNTYYEFQYPIPGNFYLVISRKIVNFEDINATPSYWQIVEKSKAYIGQLSSMTMPDWSFQTNAVIPPTYTFSKICELEGMENGIIISKPCKKGAITLRGSVMIGDTIYKVYCFPITLESIHTYFPGFENLSLAQRIVTTQVLEPKMPEGPMRHVFSFLERNGPGPVIGINNLRSTAETRAPDPNETPLTEEEFEKMQGTKKGDTKGDTKAGRKTKRRRRRKSSRKNRKTSRRRHK